MATNERIVNGVKTRVLHGKDYVEVAERLRVLYDLKKSLEVQESGPFEVADRWVWRIVVLVDGKRYVGNAEVKLNAPKNTPDGTNPFECAEVSALGRALAFAGLGTVESIASYEEIMRSQPFVAVVEDPYKRVVEAKEAPKQIEQPKVQTSLDTALKERLNVLYEQVFTLGLIPKSNDTKENVKTFFRLASEIIGAKVEAPGQLTSSRLDAIEQYVNSKDAA